MPFIVTLTLPGNAAVAAQCIPHPGLPQQGCGVTLLPCFAAGRPLTVTFM